MLVVGGGEGEGRAEKKNGLKGGGGGEHEKKRSVRGSLKSVVMRASVTAENLAKMPKITFLRL